MAVPRFGEVRVVAPDVEMSSASHSITASRPVSYKHTPLPGFDAYRVNGTPGDCVMLGGKVLEMLLEVPDLPLVNVNFPPRPPRGTVWTRQSMRHYDGKVVPGKDPMERTHYWFTVVPVEATEEGTDRWAIEQGYVSMTPLRLDLTDHRRLAAVAELEQWKLSFA